MTDRSARLAKVLLTDGAARDLDEWYATAYAQGGPVEATRILDRIRVVLSGLGEGALRDEPLPELRPLGIVDERQHVTDDGMRVVFRRQGDALHVVAIAPLKRSFQTLLQRRLLDA